MTADDRAERAMRRHAHQAGLGLRRAPQTGRYAIVERASGATISRGLRLEDVEDLLAGDPLRRCARRRRL